MTYRFRKSVVVLSTALGLAACTAPMQPALVAGVGQGPVSAECNPRPESDRSQYIIGYGSLMQDESRKRSSPQAGPARPVEVSGYRRGWFAKGGPVGYSTTFLGVLPDPRGHLNAVIYQVEIGELAVTDQREASYCRQSVDSSEIKELGSGPPKPPGAQVWIYANSPRAVATPSASFPIAQSYVDIFVSGCLEQEQRFALTGFAQQCLATTQDWSKHWINDRLYPRRPFIFQPRSGQIDALLSQQLPEYFSQIAIE